MVSVKDQAQRLAKILRKDASKLVLDLSPKRLHRLRSTIRRLEALLEYLQPSLPPKEKRMIEAMAALSTLAGKVRDLEIQLGLLKAIGNGSTAMDRRRFADSLRDRKGR